MAALMEWKYEPESRVYHYGATVEGRIYVWGGIDIDTQKDLPVSTVEIFSPNPTVTAHSRSPPGIWSQSRVKGPSPPGKYCGVSASLGHYLYVYGGYSMKERGIPSSLHRLDITTFTWTEISKHDKIFNHWNEGGAMVCYKEKLVLFMNNVNQDEYEVCPVKLLAFDLREGD